MRRTVKNIDGTREAAVITNFRAGQVVLKVSDDFGLRTATFTGEAIAELLHNIIPGLTVTYTKPAPPIPTNFGAIIETKGGTRYVLADNDDAPWRRDSNQPGNELTWVTDLDVSHYLADGGKILSEGVN